MAGSGPDVVSGVFPERASGTMAREGRAVHAANEER